jgi:predicted O-methyltransferase YrrM
MVMLDGLGRPLAIIKALAAEPTEFFIRVAGKFREWPDRYRPIRPYSVEPDWFELLHAYLRVPSPCAEAAELEPLWDQVASGMRAKGINIGPMSYLVWNDGDPGLVRAIWCLIRHLKPRKIVETGVAHGVTSRFILEALSRNGGGHLWSIDLPPLFQPEVHTQIGVAVRDAQRSNWTYIKGSSRRRLPDLLRRTSPIDLFIHDSMHSTDNVMFELRQVWPVLRPGGAIVVDDIDSNNAFHQFCEEVPHHPAWVCEAEPFRPDERRVNLKGMFGIIIRAPLV